MRDLTSLLDPGGGWYGVFRQRDPDGLRACFDGVEIPPWDVVESLLQDFGAGRDAQQAAAETARARRLHSASAAAYDRRAGGEDALAERLRLMVREQAYAVERADELVRRLRTVPAGSPEGDQLAHDLAWVRDDHARASARCAELRSRLTALTTPGRGGPTARPVAPEGWFREEESPSDEESVFGTRDPAPGSARRGSRGTGASAGAAPGTTGRPGTDPRAGMDFRAGTDLGPGPDFRPGTDLRPGTDPRAGMDPRPSTDFRPGADGRSGTDPHPGMDPRAGTGTRPDGSGSGGGASSAWAGAPRDVGARGGVASQEAYRNGPGAPAPRDRVWGPGAPGVGGAAGAGPYRDAAEPAPVRDDPYPAPVRDAPAPLPDGSPPQWAAGAPREEDAAPPRQKKRGSGAKRKPRGARFAGLDLDDDADEPVATPLTETPPPTARDTPRGARFGGALAGVARPAEPVHSPEDLRAAAGLVASLVGLRAQGRSGEAHVLLCEAAGRPPGQLPLLAAELNRAGLAADWAELLWEAASLPPDRLAAAAGALAVAGRDDDCAQLLRQGAARPAGEIAHAVLALGEAGRAYEAQALLSTFVQARTPEDAARIAVPDPRRLVPQLLDAARAVSAGHERDVVHALRLAGIGVA
ncbi:hypothetical protein [Streptomyces liangshanensis]|uniref:hypothetical protein n=1 Tax=Streptomyces liangshanensis TaxID=2717324 RepID=UPI003132BFDD